MPIELLTKDDLDSFRSAIIRDMEELLKKYCIEKEKVSFEVRGMTYKPLYKMSEVCAVFGITKPTVYDWIKKGKLKPRKIQSRVFFLWEDIKGLIEDH